ncbi:DEAD/DEAH box helicase [Flavobacterium sp. TAB 87]|uniref:DEAD/DEAH box helicase n=1 Tax=Flavobacterium sp. TAB 87 TaxID=1729581 RepID=UPI00076C6820|nr:DEAD/DEAH box helicase [Flavobacterium sp. TAB 87]KVV15588.1 Cold-shock DEAD box protein A [Flavobacterium sp. TAB 87]
MKLKKINEILQQNLVADGLTKANTLQKETFSTIKSGADCVIVAAEGTGRSTTIALNVIQQLARETEESPRALIFVESKEKVLEMEALFDKYAKGTNLEIYGIHDKGDTDYDKNYISTGVDVLIGTPNKLNDMLSTAGYNVNRLKMFIIDDANSLLKLRHETKMMRISNSIAKTQRILFTEKLTERVEILIDKLMLEPYYFDIEEEETEEEESDAEEKDLGAENEDEEEDERKEEKEEN